MLFSTRLVFSEWKRKAKKEVKQKKEKRKTYLYWQMLSHQYRYHHHNRHRRHQIILIISIPSTKSSKTARTTLKSSKSCNRFFYEIPVKYHSSSWTHNVDSTKCMYHRRFISIGYEFRDGEYCVLLNSTGDFTDSWNNYK